MRKYKLTWETAVTPDGTTVSRIMAIIDFGSVKVGDLVVLGVAKFRA